jgi:CheY-like chemotaxis protein
MVVPVSSVKEAVDRIDAGDFDLIVLSYSIPAKDREHLTCLIRASGALTPIVSITETFSQHDAFLNATLDENDTHEFFADLREILSKSTNGTAY